MPTPDGYPTKAELKLFRQWRLKGNKPEDLAKLLHENSLDLVEFIKSIWWMPDRAFRFYKGYCTLIHEKRAIWKLELHTCGWSGNEEIINEFEKTVFWMRYWEKTKRGGHYYFEIPKRKE